MIYFVKKILVVVPRYYGARSTQLYIFSSRSNIAPVDPIQPWKKDFQFEYVISIAHNNSNSSTWKLLALCNSVLLVIVVGVVDHSHFQT